MKTCKYLGQFLVIIALVWLFLVLATGCTVNTYRSQVLLNGQTNLITFTRQSFLTKQNIGAITIKTKDGSEVTIGGVEMDQITGAERMLRAGIDQMIKSGAKAAVPVP